MTGSKENVRRRKTGRLRLLLVTVWVPILAVACAGSQGTNGVPAAAEVRVGEGADPPERLAPATPGVAAGTPKDGAVARAGGARAGDAVAGGDPARARAGNETAKDKADEATDEVDGDADKVVEDEERSRELALKVGGDRGTEFSGTCVVGDEEKEIEGRVPERYVFEPGEAGLECEIRKEDGGALEVVVSGDGVRFVQSSGAGESTMRFAFSQSGFSTSTSSVSLNETSTSSDGSGNGSR